MAFDSSAYRQNTYGATPDYYCDCTRSLSSNGTGTSGDPYNLTQAMGVAGGSLVWFLPVQDGAQANPVDLAAPSASGYSEIPAFNPTNSGTVGNPTVFVTKYAAVWLYNDVGKASLPTDGRRTELRHAGTAAAAAGDDETGTGGAIYGAHTKNHIIYDGFFTDMAEAEIRGDTGHLGFQACTGIQCYNFVIKGTTTNCQSNPIIYRPEEAVDTVLSNFYCYDFSNDPTGSNTQQAGLFSDQYGDRNFLIEHFEIDNVDMGIFLKGAGYSGSLNYGTIQHGIISDSASFIRFNALHATETTTVQHVLAYNSIGARPKSISPDGIVCDVISAGQLRNLTIDHVTVAKIDSTDANCNGAFNVEDNTISSGVSITNSIFDVDNGSYGNQIAFLTTLPDTLNYNFYYKNGGTETYVYNGSSYNTFAGWQAAISSRDANSAEGSSSPFNDRTNDDYTINTGHAAYTMSSTGGQVGAYGGSEVLGVDLGAAAPGDPVASVGVCFLL